MSTSALLVQTSSVQNAPFKESNLQMLVKRIKQKKIKFRKDFANEICTVIVILTIIARKGHNYEFETCWLQEQDHTCQHLEIKNQLEDTFLIDLTPPPPPSTHTPVADQIFHLQPVRFFLINQYSLLQSH